MSLFANMCRSSVLPAALFSSMLIGQDRPGALSSLKTAAERTNYVETTRYAEVMSFLSSVDAASNLVHLTSMGYTLEGRSLPLAVVGRVADARPETVKASGKLRVYIQGNVHAGEVEGKESSLMLVRDIAAGKHSDWMNSMVLLVGPIFNADGNERVSLTNRGPQHGPVGGMGTRPNAQGLNINRDYMKLETPEARSMVKMLNDYDPHAMIDLHTTNGSRHAYHLTFEVPNNPAVDPAIADLARNEWGSFLIRSIKEKYGQDFHFYGNVSGQGERSWTTVEDLPRYSHNYWGLRNRFGILEETYSYLTFADRVTTASRFLEEILNFAHGHSARIQQAAADADARSIVGQLLSIRSRPKKSAGMVEILMGDIEEEINPYSGRVMFRRTDVRKPERMWEYALFEPTDVERVPSVYYVPSTLRGVVERLQAHGIRVERLAQSQRMDVEEFETETSQQAPQAFENHRERTVTGKYTRIQKDIPAGTFTVSLRQPLARLAFYLLEPRSNDGLLTWNFLDDAMKDTKTYPIVRSWN